MKVSLVLSFLQSKKILFNKTINQIAFGFTLTFLVVFVKQTLCAEIVQSKDVFVVRNVFVDLVGYSDEKSAYSEALMVAKNQGMEALLHAVSKGSGVSVPKDDVDNYVLGFEKKSSTFKDGYFSGIFDVFYLRKDVESIIVKNFAKSEYKNIDGGSGEKSSFYTTLQMNRKKPLKFYGLVYSAINKSEVDSLVFFVSNETIDFVFFEKSFDVLKSKLRENGLDIVQNGQRYYLVFNG